MTFSGGWTVGVARPRGLVSSVLQGLTYLALVSSSAPSALAAALSSCSPLASISSSCRSSIRNRRGTKQKEPKWRKKNQETKIKQTNKHARNTVDAGYERLEVVPGMCLLYTRYGHTAGVSEQPSIYRHARTRYKRRRR